MEMSLCLNGLVALATPNLGSEANVLQVLKDKGSPLWSILDNAFGEDVIMVFSLPKQLTRKRFQVPFSRFGATLLKFAFDAEETAFLLLPTFVTKELTLRSHSGTSQAKINADGGLTRRDVWFSNGHNDMQGKASLAGTQISATCFVANILLEVFRNHEVKLNTTCNGCKATEGEVPLDPIRTLIVADRRN